MSEKTTDENDAIGREPEEMWNTHDWDDSNDLTVCRKCGRDPIDLGFWGTWTWKETHQDYLKPCKGTR